MSQLICDTTTTNGCSLVVQVEPAPLDPERVQDLLSLFYLVLAILAAVWGLRKLINLFSSDVEK